MQVVSIEDKVNNFLVRLNSKIYLTCDNEDIGMQLLESINLKLVTDPYYIKSDNTFEIIPHRLSRQITINAYPADLRDVCKIKDGEINISCSDFDASDDFYEAISKRNSPLKIIKDEFSVQRSASLFEYISKIELELRQGVYRNRHNIDAEDPANKRSKTPDDTISQYDLTEIMNKHLLKPSSETFYLSRLNAAGDDERQIVEARNTLVIDELEMPFSIDEFKSFIRVRNAIMHFRVVTFSDAELVIKFHEKLMQYDILQLARRIADREFVK